MESAPGRPDYVARALHALDGALDTVHDSVLRPLIIAARFVALGLIIAVATVVLLIALLVGAVRLLDVYLFSGRVWATYFLLSFVFLLIGGVCWRFRASAPTRS